MTGGARSSTWLDGVAVPAGAPAIPADDRGLLLGDALFETVRVRRGRGFRLGDHLARLRRSAAALGFPVPAALDAWVQVALDASAQLDDAALRLTLTRGAGPPGVMPPDEPAPRCLVTVRALPPEPDAPPAIACVVTSTGRRNEHAATAGHKTTAYLDAVVALADARRRGVDDALILDTAGHLSEATASNLFAVADGRLLTPPASCGALPGVTRALVLALAAEAGIRADVRPIDPGELAGASEIFLTSALRGIAAVTSLDGRPVGPGAAGPVARRLAGERRRLLTDG